MSEQPTPPSHNQPPYGQPMYYQPVYAQSLMPLNPKRGKALRGWGIGLVVFAVAAVALHAFNLTAMMSGAIPYGLTSLLVIIAIPAFITGVVLWPVGQHLVKDTAAKLAFMAQQAGGAR